MLWALFLLSAGITSYQLALMQILSYLQWYHFAYLVVSLALLGFGASGTILSLFKTFFTARKGDLLPWLLIGCGLSMPWAANLTQSNGLRCDFYLLFVDKTQFWRLAASSLLYLIPFLLGALAIGLALTTNTKNAGKLYCANLTGSGAGGLLGLALATLFLPADLPALTGLAPVVGGLLLFAGKNWPKATLAIALAIGVNLLLFVFPGRFIPSQFKDISRALNLPNSVILFQAPSPKGLVQVVQSSSLRYAPGLSLNYRGPIPVQQLVFLNGDAFGALPFDFGGPYLQKNLSDYTTEILGYTLAKAGGKVLLLQPGDGEPVTQAIGHKMTEVVLVEPHGEIFPFYVKMSETLGNSFSGQPKPHMVNDDPRHFLALREGKFDLIRLPTVGSFGGTAGLQALSEQFLLTRESFQDAWENLGENGLIMITCWMDYPIKTSYKIASTLAEVMEELGVTRPERHLIAIRSWGAVTFVLKKVPVSARETAMIRNECEKFLFDPLLLPDIRKNELQVHNSQENDDFFDTLTALLSPQRQEIYKGYAFNLRPATDDNPFFYQFLRWSRLPALAKTFGMQGAPFFELGSLILALNLALLGILALILIILPLFKLGWKSAGGGWTLVYFGSLGSGFMLLEIVLMQKLTLFLGGPILAAAAAISGLLFFSGLGSLFSSRFAANSRVLRQVCGLSGLLVVIFAISTVILHRYGGSLPTPLLTVTVLALIAPLGFAMGFPFPLGLRVLEKKNRAQLPWAWGINGCFSVISPAVGLAVALHSGFNAVFGLAALSYLLAACVNLTSN